MARVRKRKDTPERIKTSSLIYQAEELKKTSDEKLQWHKAFNDKKDATILEIGTGRGRFITLHAKAYPAFNHFGVDIVPEILVDAVDKHDKGEGIPDNLRFLLADAKALMEIFKQGEISRIYLNFSDPWPKKRHAKRRLTHHHFLEVYAYLLKKGGELIFKTDGEALFDFSLEELREHGWTIKEEIRDLYAHLPEDNIATEYEHRFVRQGLPIYKLIAIKND